MDRLSLLWPQGRPDEPVRISRQARTDLGIDAIAHALNPDGKGRNVVNTVLDNLTDDAATIDARLAVVDDVIASTTIRNAFEKSLSSIGNLRYFVIRSDGEEWNDLKKSVWRLRELEHYVTAVETIGSALDTDEPRSDGLIALHAHLNEVRADPTFQNLQAELPGMLDALTLPRSLTVGVNVDGGLVPTGATLLSINAKEFHGTNLYTRLIGESEWHGIAQLHSVEDYENVPDPLMIPLFADLAKLLAKTTKPLADELRRFVAIESRLLVRLYDDLLFFVSVARLIERMRKAGLPMTRPRIKTDGGTYFSARGMFNLHLALTELSRSDDGGPLDLVANDVDQARERRIAIITGPNRGGKTTYLQAVGIVQVMAQAGLYVPAESVELSPVDAILTHYPAPEAPEKGTGRFGEEAQRMRELVESVSARSLVLLNESFSSTSLGESVYLVEDLMRVFRDVGCRVLYTTHIHQLAQAVDRMNDEVSGDPALVSLVAEIEDQGDGEITPTFRIVAGPPAGQSYALQLARRFGLSRQQMMDHLRDRNVVD
jgi:DNA mismatch repair protein MutS